jgi:hypothetical protein
MAMTEPETPAPERYYVELPQSVKDAALETIVQIHARLAEDSKEVEGWLAASSLGADYKNKPLLVQIAHIGEGAGVRDGSNRSLAFQRAGDYELPINLLRGLTDGFRNVNEAAYGLNLLANKPDIFLGAEEMEPFIEAHKDALSAALNVPEILAANAERKRLWAGLAGSSENSGRAGPS